MSQPQHVFSLPAFRVSFPMLATVPDDQLQSYWDMATATMTSTDGLLLRGESLQLALTLMTAHLAWLFTRRYPSGATGQVSSATEGSVSVSMAIPPYKNGWQFWLTQSPFGNQLWALLQIQSAGGLYVGGSPERAAFRKAGGVW